MVGDILQPTHLLFILVVALLVLGPKRLPEVGRTLGSGIRDFRQAINGEATSHQEHEPRGYVEPEPDPVPAHAAGADETEPTDLHVAADPATPTALHDLEPTGLHDLEPTGLHDLEAPAATDDLEAPVATDDLEPPAASDHDAAIGDRDDTATTTQPVAAASSTGFASALAASRQQPADGDEPAADDE